MLSLKWKFWLVNIAYFSIAILFTLYLNISNGFYDLALFSLVLGVSVFTIIMIGIYFTFRKYDEVNEKEDDMETEDEFDFDDEKVIDEWSNISEDSLKEDYDDDDFDIGPIEEETMG